MSSGVSFTYESNRLRISAERAAYSLALCVEAADVVLWPLSSFLQQPT
jgi:hypothetical protein